MPRPLEACDLDVSLGFRILDDSSTSVDKVMYGILPSTTQRAKRSTGTPREERAKREKRGKKISVLST